MDGHLPALRSLLADATRELAGARLLVVAHDVVIQLTRAVVEGLDERATVELVTTTAYANCGSPSSSTTRAARGWTAATGRSPCASAGEPRREGATPMTRSAAATPTARSGRPRPAAGVAVAAAGRRRARPGQHLLVVGGAAQPRARPCAQQSCGAARRGRQAPTGCSRPRRLSRWRCAIPALMLPPARDAGGHVNLPGMEDLHDLARAGRRRLRRRPRRRRRHGPGRRPRRSAAAGHEGGLDAYALGARPGRPESPPR